MDQVRQLSPQERAELRKVSEVFAFRCSEYYLSLIDWDDPEDPLRRTVIPDLCELEEWGDIDPSDEQSYTVMPGVEHKYPSTILVLVSSVCQGICRYCFRKRVFFRSQQEVLQDVDGMIEYVRQHHEATNILLSGGDPLCLDTAYIENIVARLRQIDHVRIIRIGTKVPVFNPQRIIDDARLLDMIRRYSLPDRKIYIMTHFSHPRELTPVATRALALLERAGAMVANQCPLIRGVNDDPHVLAELFTKVACAGAIPYYLFQCRPALGNRAYTVPIETGYAITEQAKRHISGLAKRFRYVMSHATGKIEIVAATCDFVYFKYHRAARDIDSARLLVFRSNPDACWLDDYGVPLQDSPVDELCLSSYEH